ncbi:MAG: 16S rRNA (cytosine(1402)-N(4))-methyltransferase RsmH [Pseudomonadota bacterium]
MRDFHTPVLAREVIDLLKIVPGGCYCDATVGGGGHAELILEHSSPDGKLIGVDQDQAAVEFCKERLARFGDRVTLLKGNFGNLARLLDEQKVGPLDGLLLDLGVSSHQFDTPSRGFSLSQEGPVDMRMDPEEERTAAKLIADSKEEELARIIWKLGEERASRKIARAIKKAQEKGELQSTIDLAQVVAGAVRARGHRKIHPATRTFMALRMAVNDELGVLARLLDSFGDLLRPGGRIAIISFHSLEDRAVKTQFGQLSKSCVCPPDLPVCACNRTPKLKFVNKKPIFAKQEEVTENHRARSARLRVAERLP